jgi:hypothetical protein
MINWNIGKRSDFCQIVSFLSEDWGTKVRFFEKKLFPSITSSCDRTTKFRPFKNLSEVLFTNRCRWHKFHPSLLCVVNNFVYLQDAKD